ncbi:hydroxymethylbilane synthase [Microbacterium endophyticum]|uniref:Porphobilinogen deaminase n=1 Tax=Microbacterium endophyticum TaxID=1526412 RepID=A0A7W4V2R3_9MICO|nr:hydroxymethylbilane synthase [Microbacterium endophyticum]MBB2975750.1 hydroxymethylbilane synthase [Microbacterium endophyticum]NIK36233.1 hydroxymethylbilane synthase [Microbacterium endophyticum]
MTSAPTPWRLGTRRSALATAQSQQVADALSAASGRDVVLVPITSEGDVSRASLSSLGGQGVFATRLREALAAGECDLLVHSLKDLPTAPAPGLVIAAIPARVDARDVVITRDGTELHNLPVAATVGTGSPRRRAQALSSNLQLEVRDIRGNVDSRLSRVRSGELDAVILAAAGISRLGADGRPVTDGLQLEHLSLDVWPTAPGQGALAIETRDDAPADLRAALSELDDAGTRAAVDAERAVLAGLDAGCHAPVGVHATLNGDQVRLNAVVYALDGKKSIGLDETTPLWSGYARKSGSGDGAEAADGATSDARARSVGEDVARRLLERGAADLAP